MTAPEAAYQQGYRDGFAGVPLPEIHPTLVEHYARGRRAGTARSGRLPPPRVALFDSEFCRAVLRAGSHAGNASSAPLGLAPDSSCVASGGEASLTSDTPEESP